MNKLQERPVRPRSHNRLAAVMVHTRRYAFLGRSRLAADAGISRSALGRLMAGRTRATYSTITKLARILEKEIGRKLDPRELVSEDGQYPTPYICDLVGCAGCLPEQTESKELAVRKYFRALQRGSWTGDNQEGKDGKWQPIPEVK